MYRTAILCTFQIAVDFYYVRVGEGGRGWREEREPILNSYPATLTSTVEISSVPVRGGTGTVEIPTVPVQYRFPPRSSASPLPPTCTTFLGPNGIRFARSHFRAQKSLDF
jgi:hypothetical protein